MKVIKESILCLTLMGLMALPCYAQTGTESSRPSGSSQPSQPSMGSQSGSMSGQSGMGQSGSMSQSGSDQSQAAQVGANAAAGMSDQDFIKKAAQTDLAEVQMAQLAQQKSQSDQVKQMAQHILNDHQQNQQQVQQLAQKQNVTLPSEPDSKHQAAMQKLQKLDGAAFDKAFLKMQAKDHQKTVALFQQMSQNAKDPDVKAYAQQTLPKLQQHLDMAKSAMKGGSDQTQTTAASQNPK